MVPVVISMVAGDLETSLLRPCPTPGSSDPSDIGHHNPVVEMPVAGPPTAMRLTTEPTESVRSNR